MKKSLIITAISLSAMFGTNASAQLFDAEQNDQFLLAANRGGNGSTRGSSNSSSSSNTSSSHNTTRSTSSSNSNSSSSSYSGGGTSRGSLQKSTHGGSDTRGSKQSSSSGSSSNSSNAKVRNNPQPRHGGAERRGHHHHDEVIIYESAPVEEYVVVNSAPTETVIVDDHIDPIMADAYFGLNLSSLGENDEHLGFCAGVSGEFGLPRSGYYGRIGARYSKQNFSVYYGNDWFPDDMSDVSIKTLQIPVTLAGYRMGGDGMSAGLGIGLMFQHGLGGTTKSEYHNQDYWDWRYEPYPEAIKERKNTFNADLMSRNDLHGLVEVYLRVDRITVYGEASVGFISDNRFPNKMKNWDCSRNLTATNFLLSIGYRLY